MLTADAIQRMHHYADDDSSRARELVGSPVGQIVGMMDKVQPVSDIMAGLVRECAETMVRLADADVSKFQT